MSKKPRIVSDPISMDEWRSLPITFGVGTTSRVFGCGTRYVQDHARELGGHKVGGRWIFSKPYIADMLGI